MSNAGVHRNRGVLAGFLPSAGGVLQLHDPAAGHPPQYNPADGNLPQYLGPCRSSQRSNRHQQTRKNTPVASCHHHLQMDDAVRYR